MTTAAAIPARLQSRRLPRKVLATIAGQPMLWHAWNCAKRAEMFDTIWIVTDSEEVANEAEHWGARVLMSAPECQSGTDRIASVLSRIEADFVVNVQADEPLLPPSALAWIVEELQRSHGPPVVTAVFPITDVNQLDDSNVVKVVRSASGDAIYFSRSAVPYVRDIPRVQWLDHHQFWGHVGLYGFKRDALAMWRHLPNSANEVAERLEQLRLVDVGIRIGTVILPEQPMSVDTPDDLAAVRLHVESCRLAVL